MNAKKYYSLRELSQELDIPKSTIVKYKDFFPEFFIMHGEGKRKKFDETGYSVLRDIRQLREDQKMDWMEIRETLETRYKDLLGKEEEKAIVEQQQNMASKANARLDHLSHLFTALTGEVVRVGAVNRKIQQQQESQSRMLLKLHKSFERLQHDVELLIMETVNRTDANRKAVKDLSADGQAQFKELKAQFAEVRKGMDTLAIKMRTPPPQQTAAPLPARPNGDSQDFQQLMSKIDKLSEEGAVTQSKYQILLRENDLLKSKIREATRLQEDEPYPEKPRKGGLLGNIFRKE
jgi:ACT domain-containing protein